MMTAIRKPLREVDKSVPLTGVRTQEDKSKRTLTRELTFAHFTTVLGLLRKVALAAWAFTG